MTEQVIDLDDATDGIFYLGEQGVTTVITGSFKPELILETYDGVKSKRLYRFPADEQEDECFRFAYKDLTGVDCPVCGCEQFVTEVNHAQDHEDDCDFLFNPEDLVNQTIDKNKECNKWWWCDSPHHKLESALIQLFDGLKITKMPHFKDLKKQIEKAENKIKKEIDPNYLTAKELDKMYQRYKKENLEE